MSILINWEKAGADFERELHLHEPEEKSVQHCGAGREHAAGSILTLLAFQIPRE